MEDNCDFNVNINDGESIGPTKWTSLVKADLRKRADDVPTAQQPPPLKDIDKRLDDAVARAQVVSDEIGSFLKHIHSRSRYRKTDPSIQQCSSFVTESIIWADRGVNCALHNANGKWEREAMEGGRRALNFQIGFPGINSLQNVTGWWDEMAKSLSQTRRGIDSRKDSTEPIENLERFRAYATQLRELQDLYPAPAVSLIATMSKHLEIPWPF
ncbi:hypothetical protein C8J56DRAFT_1115959 [Mycena floridula]|nr:hypothetical protein C8J56DRAFT_1115959 [Mycena floridula]